MTLFRKGARTVYLAHPPKTSGTSITVMLQKSGWRCEWHRDSKAPVHFAVDFETFGYDPATDA